MKLLGGRASVYTLTRSTLLAVYRSSPNMEFKNQVPWGAPYFIRLFPGHLVIWKTLEIHVTWSVWVFRDIKLFSISQRTRDICQGCPKWMGTNRWRHEIERNYSLKDGQLHISFVQKNVLMFKGRANWGSANTWCQLCPLTSGWLLLLSLLYVTHRDFH